MPVNGQRPGQARDNQRSRLYKAEDVLRGRRVSMAAERCLVDVLKHSWLHVEDPKFVLPPESEWPIYTKPETGETQRLRPVKYISMRYPTVEAVQAYMDEVTSSAWYVRRWGVRHLTYVNGKGSHASNNHVTVACEHRRSEAVVLHEMAHCLAPRTAAWHGPEFAAILLTLVKYQMGPSHANDLRASYSQHGVRYRGGMKAVPTPDDARWQDVKAAKASTRKGR